MEQFFTEIVKSYGLPVGMLLVAVYWLNRNSNEAYAKLDQERSARIDGLNARIEDLRKQVDECSADRRKLWEEIQEMKRR
jgi:hypothetical protein